MNTLTNNQKVLISALVGFIVGAAAVWVWSVAMTPQQNAQELGQDEEVREETESEGELTSAPGGDAQEESAQVAIDDSDLINVSDQAAGAAVAFSVAFDEPGWVAIHEERDGTLGNVLGAKWLPAGTHEATVKLLRNTVSGQTYHAVLYHDDGDRQFEVSSEARLLDGSKQPIQTAFDAQ